MFRFSIRDVLWLTAVVAVGLTGVIWVNRFVYSDKHAYRLYLEQWEKRASAEAEILALQAEIKKLRSELQAEPNP